MVFFCFRQGCIEQNWRFSGMVPCVCNLYRKNDFFFFLRPVFNFLFKTGIGKAIAKQISCFDLEGFIIAVSNILVFCIELLPRITGCFTIDGSGRDILILQRPCHAHASGKIVFPTKQCCQCIAAFFTCLAHMDQRTIVDCVKRAQINQTADIDYHD